MKNRFYQGDMFVFQWLTVLGIVHGHLSSISRYIQPATPDITEVMLSRAMQELEQELKRKVSLYHLLRECADASVLLMRHSGIGCHKFNGVRSTE